MHAPPSAGFYTMQKNPVSARSGTAQERLQMDWAVVEHPVAEVKVGILFVKYIFLTKRIFHLVGV